MREYVPTYPDPGDDDRPAWEKKLRPLFSAAEDVEGEGARPSSLIRAHEMPDPGRGYALMLMREVSITYERTVRELGPVPPGGLPMREKAKPKAPYRDFLGNVVPEAPIVEEDDEVKLKEMAAAAVLALGATACTSATPVDGSTGASSSHMDKTIQAPKTDAATASSTSRPTPATVNASDDPKPTNDSLGPEYKTVDSFFEFRRKLLADGWVPVINPNCHQAVLGYDYGKVCKANPEDSNCLVCDKTPEIVSDIAGVGYVDGYNLMHYTKNGLPLSVTVYGDIRGIDDPKAYELVVVGWEFTLSHDVIPLDEHVPREGK